MKYRTQDLSLFKVPENFRGRNVFVVQLWWCVQATLFRWSPQVAYAWRRLLLRCFGAKIGPGVLIRPSASFTYPWKVSIGENSWIGDNATLYSLGPITIGDNSVVSQDCYLCAGDHDYRLVDFPIRSNGIRIGSEVWVAASCFVAPGISIGDRCVIGARSTVIADTAPGTICVGHPAKAIKERTTIHGEGNGQ